MGNERKNNDEVEIDLRQIFSVIFSKIVVIIIVGLIFGVAALIGSKLFIKPTYQTKISMIVLNRQSQGTTTYNDLQSSTQLTQDYMVLIKHRAVTGKVISELNLDMTNEKLSKMISVSTQSNTRILDVVVSSHDPYQAKQIADKVAQVAADYIVETMQTEKVTIMGDERGEAPLPTKPVSPNLKRNGAIAAILGLLLATAVVVIRFVMNDRINTSEDVEKYLGLSTLALIPMSEDLDDSKDSSGSKKKGKKKSGKSSGHSSKKGAK